MKVENIAHMGDDLMVVNAARVSYKKRHDWFRPADARLLKYLADHNHWTPFAHPQLSFRISASIAVARQLYRHQVGLAMSDVRHRDEVAVNETSRRYVTDTPTFDLPDVWRSAPGAGQSKQGSGEPMDGDSQAGLALIAEDVLQHCQSGYQTMIDAGVAPEQARLMLPMALVTEWIWTGSVMAFIRVCKERLAPDAQAETRQVVEVIFAYLRYYFPESALAWGLTE